MELSTALLGLASSSSSLPRPLVSVRLVLSPFRLVSSSSCLAHVLSAEFLVGHRLLLHPHHLLPAHQVFCVTLRRSSSFPPAAALVASVFCVPPAAGSASAVVLVAAAAARGASEAAPSVGVAAAARVAPSASAAAFLPPSCPF